MNTDLLKQLISIPSYVDENSNEEQFAIFLEKYINDNLPWLTTERQIVEEKRFNLIAKGKENPKIIFLSHMDTVLPSGDIEKCFEPYEKDSKLYGLGSADMKGGMAMAILATQNNPRNDVALIFDCDEEYYFKGAKKLLKEYSFNPEILICPEPTDLKIINGCRGIFEIEFNVIGKTAHAGTPDNGVNAIENSIYIVDELKAMLQKEQTDLGLTTVNLSAINGGRQCEKEIKIQANAVPDIAHILLDIRVANTKITKEYVIEKLTGFAKKRNIQLKNIQFNIEYAPLLTEKEDLKAFESLLIDASLNIQYEDISKVGFFESAIFCKAWNCPGVIFGPIGEGHIVGESVGIESLEKTYEVFDSFLKKK